MDKNGKRLLCLLLAAAVLGGIFWKRNAAQGPLQIGVSIYLDTDTFVGEIIAGMKEAAQEYEEETGRKVALHISAANSGQRLQNEQVRRFMELGYDAVCVNMVDRTSASSIIDIVLGEDPSVPVIFFNREPVPEDIMRGERIYYVDSDAKQSAVLQGESVAESLRRHPEMDKNGDGILQYVMLEGEMGHQDAIMRSEYSVRTIEEAGIALKKLDSGTADWERGRAKLLMEQWLGDYGDRIELVLCNNDDMALGALEALEEAGILAAVFGVDATEVGMEALEEGRLWGTVDCNGAAQGKAVFRLAAGIATEGKPPKDMLLADGRYARVPLYKRMAEE